MPALILAAWLLTGSSSFAQNVIRIIPHLALEEDAERAFVSEKQRSSGIVEGAGGLLRISYTSSIPVPTFVTPFNSETTYNPGDTLQLELPSGTQQIAEIDITAHSAWKPWHNKYYVLFLSSAEDNAVTIDDVQLQPVSFWETVSAAISHVFEPEIYKVSTVHLMMGYRMLGVSLLPLLGMIALFVAGILLARRASTGTVLLVLAGFSLFYSARVTADMVSWSADHQKEWRKGETYAVADDMHSVAAFLQQEAHTSASPQRVSICHDSTNYYTKLLRYLLYPIPVITEQGTGPLPTYMVVAKKIHWSFDDGILDCGGRRVRADKLDTFQKGATVFLVTEEL